MSLMTGNTYFLSVEAHKVAARLTGSEYLDLKGGEEVLIFTDTTTEAEMWKILMEACTARGAHVTLAVIPSWKNELNPYQMTKVLQKAYLGADVVINILYTFYPVLSEEDLEYRNKRKEEGRPLKRLVLQCRTLRSMISPGGGPDADPDEYFCIGEKIRPYYETGKLLHMTSKLGTDFTIDLEKARPFTIRNYLRICFPDGEIAIYPRDKTCNGTLVCDGPISHIRESSGVWGQTQWEPITLKVKNSRYVEVIGDSGDADKFRWLFKNLKNANVCGEFALGTNRWCLQSGEFSEEKKRLGNVHIAYGGGMTPYVTTSPSILHSDMVFRKPKVEIDGVTIIENGELRAR